jgi:hypothetical protein
LTNVSEEYAACIFRKDNRAASLAYSSNLRMKAPQNILLFIDTVMRTSKYNTVKTGFPFFIAMKLHFSLCEKTLSQIPSFYKIYTL